MIHHIRRQILDLELPRETGALALQRQFAQVLQEKVMPKLDELFSQIAPAGHILRIPRLEVDLGRLGEANWEKQFVEHCVEQIAKQLTDLVQQAEFAPDLGLQSLNTEENAVNVLAFFLETGTLPWHAVKLTLKALEIQLSPVLVTSPKVVAQRILPILQQKRFALRRLIWQFSPPFVEQLLEAGLSLKPTCITQALALVQHSTHTQLNPAQKELVFAKLLTPNPAFRLNPSTEPVDLLQLWNPLLFLHVADNQPKIRQEHSVAQPQTISVGASNEPAVQAVEDQAPIPSARAYSSQNTQLEGISVEDAGLVLLGPYLPHFFQELGIVASGAFSEPEAQYRAIHLLHYLVTGQEHPEEPALILPKILCGLPLEEPVPLELDLQESEKEEAEVLLQALIQNWPVLKNTSPDGLRSGFLQRMGLLSPTELPASWILRVERVGQDLLLDRLPWSFSVVKLPWMEGSLQVDW